MTQDLPKSIKIPNDILSVLTHRYLTEVQYELRTANLLIRFKLDVHDSNDKLRRCIQIVLRTNNFKICNKNKSNIKKLKTHLIFYMSTWLIYIQQGTLNHRDVRKSLGNFLDDDYLLLKSVLNSWSNDKSKTYHDDAVNCTRLFQECANIGNGGNR